MGHINDETENCHLRVGDDPGSGTESMGSRSSASRLPPELLTLVFRELQLLHGWNKSHRHPGSRQWLRITWVCRCWREVALSAPALWSFIQSASACTDHAFVEAALERARRVPLNIDLTFASHGDRAPSLLASLFVHSQRIQVMRLQMLLETSTMQLFFESMAASRLEMPLLECLSIADRAVDDADGNPLPYLSHLTREHVPRLHTLHLSFAHFPWNSSIYSSLLSLDLVSVRTPPTIEEFLNILRECPGLWMLHVDNALPPVDLAHQPLPEDRSVVILPWLERMSLTGEYPTVAYICDLLWVPCSCEVNIEYNSTRGFSANPVEVLLPAALPTQHVFREVVPSATSLSLRSEVLVSVQDDEDTISIVHLDFIAGERQHSSVRFDSACGGETDIDADSWQQLLHTFRRAPLSNTNFAPIDTITQEMWRALFRRFPMLDTIEVGSSHTLYETEPEDMHGAIPFLQSLVDPDPDTQTLSAPSLQYLTMKDFPMNTNIVARLRWLIQTRKAAGKPLKRLALDDVVFLEGIRSDKVAEYFKEADADIVISVTSDESQ
ncbi:hypothetical protein C8Q73DRAFT_285472 [Cubamyces lactineus]|nr:hypothetical protein C8Q73DRAFT_285472 [Cubamyces lactineus]